MSRHHTSLDWKRPDVSGLPEWAQRMIINCPVDINIIWSDWADTLPVAYSKRAAFVASTKATLERAGFRYSDKTIGMITDALLRFYMLPGKSDLEHPTKGFYGWTPRNQEATA